MALPFGPYQGQDLTSFQEGNKFLPRQFYSLNPPIQTNTIGNTGGITGTQAAGSYMGYPSYEAWLLAQGGGGAGGGPNGGPDEIEEDTFSMGMSPGAMGGKLPGFGNWAKRTFGPLAHAYSQLPTPTNLLFKGIRHWKGKRDTRIAEEKIAADKAAADAAVVNKQQWQQDYSNWQSPSGRDHATTGGIGSPESKAGGAPGTAEASSDWRAQGGRIGYNRGRVVNPGGYQGDIEIPDGFLEGLPNEDYQKMIEELMKRKKHEELMRESAPSQWAAEGGRIGYNRGRVVNPGGYQGEEEGVDSIKHFIMLEQIEKLEKMIASGLDSDGRLQASLDQLNATPTTGFGTGPDLVLPDDMAQGGIARLL